MGNTVQTELDLTKIMVLLQRRFSAVSEIEKLTGELTEAFERNDDVSAALLLQMRADEMEKADMCLDEIWQFAEDDRKGGEKLRTLMLSDPLVTEGENFEEKKIYEIRQKIRVTAEHLRAMDERLNRSVAREKSFYGAGNMERESGSANA